VALECENFLGPRGFGAVQVSPANEHAVLPGFPWYQRYQPVSYQLTSRSGTREEFIDMVRRCKAVGVDIYADAVINHMAWVNRSGSTLYGSAGSPYDEYHHPGLFQSWDFNRCGRNRDDSISNYQDRWEVQNCNLATCADLKTGSEYVRGKIADYLNDLLSIGVSGFRIDAAKHIAAQDLQAIFSRLNRYFYPFQEVIDLGGEPIRSDEYFPTGDVTDFRYSRELARAFNGGRLAWLERFGPEWGFLPNQKAIVFVDNHDIQRGHGAGGEVLTHKDAQKYVLANVFMLAWPYGYTQVMSSYKFRNTDQGPPSNSRGETSPVYVNGAVRCGQEWVCEHRWQPVAGMVGFRNFTQTTPYVSRWWTNGMNQIAFARGNRGYTVINYELKPLRRFFDTGLPAGTYCDVISGEANRAKSSCSGTRIVVDRSGWAEINVAPLSAVAIHGGAALLN